MRAGDRKQGINKAWPNGGAIEVYHANTVTISGSELKYNEAGCDGGAIYVYDTKTVEIRCCPRMLFRRRRFYSKHLLLGSLCERSCKTTNEFLWLAN